MDSIRRGAVARREDRLEDAHRDFEQAVVLARQGGARAVLVQALRGLGEIERALGRGDAARCAYEEAVSTCRGGGDLDLLAHTIRHLGDVHREARRFDLAEACYEEALALYRENGRTAPLDLANAIRPLAILQEGKVQASESIRLWREAMDLYGAVGVAEGVAECSRHLARLKECAPAR